MLIQKNYSTRFIIILGIVIGVLSFGAIPVSAANAELEVDLIGGSGIYFSGGRTYYNEYDRRRLQPHTGHNKIRRGEGHRYDRRHYKRRNYRHKRHYRQSHHVCGPRRAVNKAYRLGLDHPQIQRIKQRRIVVAGYQYGYRTKMVFDRYSRCRLIKTVNFGW